MAQKNIVQYWCIMLKILNCLLFLLKKMRSVLLHSTWHHVITSMTTLAIALNPPVTSPPTASPIFVNINTPAFKVFSRSLPKALFPSHPKAPSTAPKANINTATIPIASNAVTKLPLGNFANINTELHKASNTTPIAVAAVMSIPSSEEFGIKLIAYTRPTNTADIILKAASELGLILSLIVLSITSAEAAEVISKLIPLKLSNDTVENDDGILETVFINAKQPVTIPASIPNCTIRLGFMSPLMVLKIHKVAANAFMSLLSPYSASNSGPFPLITEAALVRPYKRLTITAN